jgi:Domain of Unknown Function with PDB structure (DUF3857)/Transglutaminase-like superfamily
LKLVKARQYMKKIITIIIVAALTSQADAQKLKLEYMIGLIPDSMRKNASSVVREEEYLLNIDEPGKGKMTVKRVVTVFNEKDKDELTFSEYIDEFQDVSDIEINLYNELGILEKKVKRKELHEQSASGSSLISDDKVVYAEVYPKAYPATVEISYTIAYKGFLEYPDFQLQRFDQSVQHAYYAIRTTTDNEARFRAVNSNLAPKKIADEKYITYYWEIKNVPAAKFEDGANSYALPKIIIAPAKFEMDDFLGDMSSWKSFGDWQRMLIDKNNELDNSRKKVLQDLVKNETSEIGKIKKVYTFLQDNYRYVSIQLGIGGWKPFEANFVHEKKYGDCKALSNYTLACLAAVGIKSHYAVIKAGKRYKQAETDFPTSDFNHIILCVPNGSDSVWLECTSKNNYAGFLGSFTENRQAMLITENGGVLVNTPKSKSTNNLFFSKADIQFDGEAIAKAKVNLSASGDFIDYYDAIKESDEERKKRIFYNYLNFKVADEFTFQDNSFTHAFDRHGTLQFQFEKLHEFSAGTKHFFAKHLNKLCDEEMTKYENRKYDFSFDYPYEKYDTTVYHLGDVFTAEMISPTVELKNEYGYYKFEMKVDAANKTATVISVFKLLKHQVPAKDYNKVYDFIEAVKKDENEKIIFKKQ